MTLFHLAIIFAAVVPCLVLCYVLLLFLNWLLEKKWEESE